MGISYSRSLRFGALRFNFSSSGIGVSAGVPGFRIGTGPRGAYISAGAGGFRYRQSLGANRRRVGRRAPSTPGSYGAASAQPAAPQNNVAATMHHSSDVMTLVDATSDDLLASLNEQAKRTVLWPFAAGACLLLLLVLKGAFSEAPDIVFLLMAVLCIGMICWVRHVDQLRKLTVLFFEVDAVLTTTFGCVVDAVTNASTIAKIQAILSTSVYRDTKYTAGAGQGVQTGSASMSVGQAPGIVANIDVPIVRAGKMTLAFFPDRMLAFGPGAVAGVSYSALQIGIADTRFVEKQELPHDAKVVEHTWQYVNKKGGPDRRFKDNRQYPVCLYQELHLNTAQGFDFRLMGSRPQGFSRLAADLRQLGATARTRS